MRRKADGEKSPRSTPVVQSVDRALKILRLFSEADALRVTDVSQRLGVSKSVVSKALNTLEKNGFVMCDVITGEYVVGPSAYVLGQLFKPGQVLNRVVKPILEELLQRTGFTSQLAILADTHMTIASTSESMTKNRLVASYAEDLPLHATASGKAALSLLSDEQAADCLEKARLRPYTAHTKASGQEILRDIAGVRELGFSLILEEWHAGAFALAVPCWIGRTPSAVVVAGSIPLSDGFDYRHIVPLVQQARDQIEGKLKGFLSETDGIEEMGVMRL